MMKPGLLLIRMLTGCSLAICITATVNGGIFGRAESRRTNVEHLAERIDRLEEHIDEYGSVVAKTPDVWGEARLTQHRQEFEQRMKQELYSFRATLQGSIERRDAAFLANATAISSIVNGGQALQAQPPAMSVSQSMIADPLTSATAGGDILPRRGFNTTKSSFEGSRVTKEGTTETSVLKIGLEPTVMLDQHARFLNHLHQLRRIQQGDDASDSPGYALYLVRVPVSVLPGKKTREGYGAEITMTMTPHLGDNLLQNTFRELVINDIADRIALPITRLALADDFELYKAALEEFQNQNSTSGNNNDDSIGQFISAVVDVVRVMEGCPPRVTPSAKDNVEQKRNLETKQYRYKRMINPRGQTYRAIMRSSGMNGATPGLRNSQGLMDNQSPSPSQGEATEKCQRWDNIETHKQEIRKHLANFLVLNSGGSSNRRSKLPLPPTHFSGIDGVTLVQLAVDARSFLKTDFKTTPLQLPDVKSFLKDELQGAYRLLNGNGNESQHLWQLAGPHLAKLVHEYRQTNEKNVAKAEGDMNSLPRARQYFLTSLKNFSGDAKTATVGMLSWQIIVEASLLSERLNADMKDLAQSKNCACMPVDGGFPFYLPNPPMEASEAFKQYVRCRWPIHVFALDPVTQDQNIADSFSRRREAQFAMALALANGSISAQNLTRYARRIEMDMETIDLNRTAVSFAHGDDTFGWRFYPRMQSPDIESNLKVITRDLILGGPNRDADIRARRIEPGTRECVALVVMPSFVPYATVDTRTNWFQLTNAKRRRMDTEKAVDLSREIVSLRELSQTCVKDAHRYRDGEVTRLIRSVEQLERRLPLQTAWIQVPYENTLGGFDMFSSGVNDLAPRLDGWYGAPGIRTIPLKEASTVAKAAEDLRRARLLQSSILSDLAQAETRGDTVTAGNLKTLLTNVTTSIQTAQTAFDQAVALKGGATTIFLVGKNFSVLETRVIAGGVDVSDTVKIISREVMQITVPPVVSTMVGKDAFDQEGEFVSIHLTTPYGVTGQLLVPVGNAETPLQVPDERLFYSWKVDSSTKPTLTRESTKLVTGGQISLSVVPHPFLEKLEGKSDLGVNIRLFKGTSSTLLEKPWSVSGLEFDKNGALIKTSEEALQKSWKEEFPKLIVGTLEGVTAIELEGFLRLHLRADGQESRIVPLTERYRVDMETVKAAATPKPEPKEEPKVSSNESSFIGSSWMLDGAKAPRISWTPRFENGDELMTFTHCENLSFKIRVRTHPFQSRESRTRNIAARLGCNAILVDGNRKEKLSPWLFEELLTFDDQGKVIEKKNQPLNQGLNSSLLLHLNTLRLKPAQRVELEGFLSIQRENSEHSIVPLSTDSLVIPLYKNAAATNMGERKSPTGIDDAPGKASVNGGLRFPGTPVLSSPVRELPLLR